MDTYVSASSSIKKDPLRTCLFFRCKMTSMSVSIPGNDSEGDGEWGKDEEVVIWSVAQGPFGDGGVRGRNCSDSGNTRHSRHQGNSGLNELLIASLANLSISYNVVREAFLPCAGLLKKTYIRRHSSRLHHHTRPLQARSLAVLTHFACRFHPISERTNNSAAFTSLGQNVFCDGASSCCL